MSHPPFQQVETLRIGVVEFVSPDEIQVILDADAPESVALNAGGPRAFPRVNGYVLIPVDDGFLVGQVEWLTVERSLHSQRTQNRDVGVINLPHAHRKMSLNPLGTLRAASDSQQKTELYDFRRGADILPSIGVGVLLPSEVQLRSIVESGTHRRIRIGTSPLAGNAEVAVDPDRLFGRHIAVLGNTGSGKSCSVAGLIRWSLEQVLREEGSTPNARFIILDPNGEYARAFQAEITEGKARLYKVDPTSPELPLKVPMWFWNSAEWCSFTQATAKTQKPTLVQALQMAKDGSTTRPLSLRDDLRRFLRTMLTTVTAEKNRGTPWGDYPKPKAFYLKLEKWLQGLIPDLARLSGEEHTSLQRLTNYLEAVCSPRREKHPVYDFTRQEISGLLDATSAAHSSLGGTDGELGTLDVDAPREFSSDSLLRSIEATAAMLNVGEYAETLLIRIRSLLSNTRMKVIAGEENSLSLVEWLEAYVGADNAATGCVSILDVSLVPTEVVHVITAVVARVVFEALQRYRRLTSTTLPTVLVVEEAHTFIKRYKEDVENQDAAIVCCQVFERIAREGRKFGLGLVVSSQRPSELSPTVLSQCNTFLLHRISNDRDQELVHRLVPDNLRGLLRELPSLPSQSAILTGWASELPILVRMTDLPRHHQPHSDDPDFWNVWRRRADDGQPVAREIDWTAVANDWQKRSK